MIVTSSTTTQYDTRLNNNVLITKIYVYKTELGQ